MKNYKQNIVLSFIMTALLLSLSGCAGLQSKTVDKPIKQPPSASAVNKEKGIMDAFNLLLQKTDVTAGTIINFINENIDFVSPQNASKMIIALEQNQQLQLPSMQEKFSDNNALQQNLAKDYRGSLTDSYINGVQDEAQKELLAATKANGFLIETAEGFYFPVIDYSCYKKYRSAVTPDLAAYIDIMAVESAKTPVKDAGLMIGWEEVLKRAVSQEQFLKEYNNSAKTEDIESLLKSYLVFALYGTNNTPLFSYEEQQMVPAAKKAYLEAAFTNNGGFSKIMTEYLVVVKKNNYQLTKEVDDYRKKAVEAFQQQIKSI